MLAYLAAESCCGLSISDLVYRTCFLQWPLARYPFPHLVELCSSHFVGVSNFWVFNSGQGSFSFLPWFNHRLHYCHYSSILLIRMYPHVPDQHKFGLGCEEIIICSFRDGPKRWRLGGGKDILTNFHRIFRKLTNSRHVAF